MVEAENKKYATTTKLYEVSIKKWMISNVLDINKHTYL